MKPTIALITIWTDHMEDMKRFYHQVLGFPIQTDLGDYVEFENSGVRFAICKRSVMYQYTNAYQERAAGQSFELAFPCDSPQAVDAAYNQLIKSGATPICEPRNMPWYQRTAFFADPDGNIHEIFAELL